MLEEELWRYLSIPVIAGVIGYGTNWVAVRMTFQPLDFVGLHDPWLGWQGIIPRKARRMAAISVDSSLGKLATIEEIFRQFDPGRLAEHLVRTLEPRLDELTDDIMRRAYPDIWERLPPPVHRALKDRVRGQLPRAARELMADIERNIGDLLDLRLMVVEHLSENKEILNRTFREVGDEEFAFIIRSGLYFGGIFGLVQMAVWIGLPQWWVLPVFGMAVGYATNWIALNLIFRPVEPVRLGPFVLHGRMLRRQDEIAEEWAEIVTHEVLTVHRLVETLLHGPRADRTEALIREHIRPIVDEAVGIARPAVELTVEEGGYAAIKEELSTRTLELSETAFEDPAFNRERAAIIEEEMRRRMMAMTPTEFQALLRPAFEEDEMTLILVGAALGGVAGTLQLFLIFGGA